MESCITFRIYPQKISFLSNIISYKLEKTTVEEYILAKIRVLIYELVDQVFFYEITSGFRTCYHITYKLARVICLSGRGRRGVHGFLWRPSIFSDFGSYYQ